MEGLHTSKSKLNLLIIDDETLLREGLVLMFRVYEGAAGVGAGHSELLRATDQYQPDVVIIGLGVRHGLDCSAIQAVWKVQTRVRFLILDESVCRENVRAALALGIRGYWTKRASFGQIAEAVKVLAGGESSFCPEVDRYVSHTRQGLRYRPAQTEKQLEMLTPRETELVALLVRGLTLRQCAQQMGVSINTVDNHKTRLMRKLGVHKSVELARLALQEGLLRER
jgi:DNA-binding NarL/FixJ family response regulator